MIKKLHFKLLLLLATVVMGAGTAWADETLTVDFESATTAYSDWTFTTFISQQTNSNVSAHGGSYFGTTSGKTTGSVVTKEKIASPQSITFYISKQSTNNTASSWLVQVSSDGTNWTQVGDKQSASSGITKGTWTEVSRDLSSYSDVYVGVFYDGTTAVRCIDDITLTYTTSGQTAVATSVTIDDAGITNTDVYAGTAAGSLSATVKDNNNTEITGAAVTWSSSNTNAATIEPSTGVVTLVAAGNTTITATYAGESGVYTGSSQTYQLTVTDSEPFNGGDVTFIAGTDMGTTTTNADGDEVTKKVVTISCTSAAFAQPEYRIYSGSTTTISTTYGKITSIQFTKTGNYNLSDLQAQGGSFSSSTGVWEGSATSVQFYATAQVRLSQIVVTIEQTASNQVETPTITVPDGAFLSTKMVTISCTTDGATVYYTTDGTEPTTSSTQYSAPFEISATTTVKAIAVKSGMTDSHIATETFTKETTYQGLAELTAITSTSNTTYYVNLTNAQVTYVNGNNGFMEDATHGIYIYNVEGLTLNTVYNGLFQVTYQLYNSLPEIKTAITSEGGTTSVASADKAATAMELSTLTANWDANLGRKIALSGVAITSTATLSGDIALSDETSTIEAGKTYDLVGYVYKNRGADQFNVVSATEVVVPSITADGIIIEADATSGNITFTVDNEVQGGTISASTTDTWITLGNETTSPISFTCAANTETTARTATVTLTYTYNTNETVTKDVTVTQAAYVAPVQYEGNFVKVTSTADITSGDYLIVYEGANVAFNGELDELDAVSNTIDVTINNNNIGATADNKKAAFTIDVENGTVRSASGKYIGVSSYANGLKQSDDADTYKGQTFAIDNGNAVITFPVGTDNVTMRFNSASNQARFRYYKSGQQDVQLYKYVSDETAPTATISAAGYATWVPAKAVAVPDDVEAYIVTSTSTSNVAIERISIIPANTPVVLKANQGTYDFNLLCTTPAALTTNLLQVSDGTNATAGTTYVLGNKNGNVGFYRWTGASSLSAGKVFLSISSSARDFFGFDNETTGIESIEHSTLNIEHSVYDMQGRRVESSMFNIQSSMLKKGLYIVNGRKVVVK